VIGLIALVVGIGLGSAAGANKTKTSTVTTPTQTVVSTTTAPSATNTVTVDGPTRTVTKTVTAPSATRNSGSSQSSGTLSWSGNGGQNIGTINVPQDSVIKWTDDGGIFQILDDENAVEVNSQASSGQSAISAGTYHHFQVNGMGNWTIDIFPQ
jgi:hypothetical protein